MNKVKRFEKAKAKFPKLVSVYAKYQYGQLFEVKCKCGTVIRTMIAAEDYGIKRQTRGVTIVQERLVLACLANYREVLMEMSDGSKHVTPACSECAEKLKHDADMREAYYAVDLMDANFKPTDKDITRTPVRVMKTDLVIED